MMLRDAILLTAVGLVGILFLGSCGQSVQQINTFEEFKTLFEKPIISERDVYGFFPKSVKQVHEYALFALKKAQQDLDTLISLDAKNRTFENTAQAFDRARDNFYTIVYGIFNVLVYNHPDQAIRDACKQELDKLKAFMIDAFSNKKIYQAFKAYLDLNVAHETLNDEQKYYLQETMQAFKREGFDLPDDAYQEVVQLKKELEQLQFDFKTNINNDKTEIVLTDQELDGVDPKLKADLKKDEKGNYIIELGSPITYDISNMCTNMQTLKKNTIARQNRAYPVNKLILEAIIAKRDQLAHLLGFESFASLDLEQTMAKTPERVEQFVQDLVAHARAKVDQEFNRLLSDWPANIKPDDSGRFNPWEVDYVRNVYEKKHEIFNRGNREVAEYFEAETTIKKIFDVYQNFLSLTFTIIKPSWSWHSDVQLIEVREKQSNVLRGFIWLDLYYRHGKAPHQNSHFPVIKTITRYHPDGSGVLFPSMSIMNFSFSKPEADKPSLLTHDNVKTFFHEFGHAMHELLGCTQMVAFSGTEVKMDFLELPSQLLEEWMFDREILKRLSAHYKTGKPLPDILIDKIIASKNYDLGSWMMYISSHAMIYLDFYKAGKKKDLDEIFRTWMERMWPKERYESDGHPYASSHHVCSKNYGPKFYTYLWSKVLAYDLFDFIKQQAPDALINPEIGKKYAAAILAPGGSKDPNLLLRDYLGREPNQDAFLRDLGVTK